MNDPDKLWAPHMPTYSPLDEFSNAYGRTNRGRPLASELAMHNANVAASGFGSRLAVVEQESAASERFFDRFVRPIPGTCAFCSTEKRHSAQRAEYDTERRRIASCSLCPRALAAAAAAS